MPAETETRKPDRTLETGAVVLVIGAAAQLFLGSPASSQDSMGAVFSMFCGGPFYLVAFILGVVAMTRGRMWGGLGLLGGSILTPFFVAAVGLSFASPEPTYEPPEPRLEVLRHSVEHDRYSTYIVGDARSVGDVQYASVEFRILTPGGAQIGTAMDNTRNLGAGRLWQFRALVHGLEEGQRFRYELAEVTAR